MESTVAPTSAATSTTRALRLAQTAGYYAAFIALGLVASALGPTLQSLAEHTHTQIRDISLLFTMRALGYLIGSVQSGFLYDRFRGHPIMALALLGLASLMALVPVTPLLVVVALIFLLLGIGEGVIDVGGNTLIVWTHGREVGPFMNGLHFCFGAGAFIAPLIVAQMVKLSGVTLW